ncbi:TetR/AcrR family transcriptional regulator [Mesorhizobium sp. LHD-90]|uniref:TetR/AcrR family transcriptional regulator n=1 Tax=Mesorhizobium sp. LHD-90 TaxID=3071414 RepID=UPI0027E0B62C|nr:TetR/AcrR family transcriptional regulator [Mesorhizobium sp. LHD-90]MDQ6437905.1 TetR/AcrR family transcriptional regulator [Mesorhizobium sp. LHD-90]
MSQRGRPRTFDRDDALRRAMELFWEKGYGGASLADLTETMGINSPSLYAAFGSKQALFDEAVDLYARTESPEIWEALSVEPTARDAVASFLRLTALSFSRPGKPAGCLIVLGALHDSDASAEACAALRRHRAENVEAVRARLERGIAEGDVPAGTDCETVARFFLTVQQGMSIQARDGATRERLHALAEGAMAAWDGLVGATATR